MMRPLILALVAVLIVVGVGTRMRWLAVVVSTAPAGNDAAEEDAPARDQTSPGADALVCVHGFRTAPAAGPRLVRVSVLTAKASPTDQAPELHLSLFAITAPLRC